MSTTIDLPRPPSSNRLWRSRTGHNGKPVFFLDRTYATWKRHCDNLLLANRKKWLPVAGPFNATITLDAGKRSGDADNRIKAVLDWLQRAELIENDKLAERVTVKWGKAPEGIRIVLTSASKVAA